MMFTVLLAVVELVSPVNDEEVRLLPENQRAVLKLETLEERKALFAKDMENGKIIRHGQWRESVPLELKWRATAGEYGPWLVEIGKKPDLSDAKFYTWVRNGVETNIVHHVRTGNFEIATKYYWRVTPDYYCDKWGHGRTCDCPGRLTQAQSAIGSFTTEDLAPRWIKIEGRVGNFRDLGGRIGLNGRRVKQNMVFRSQGLNDNSPDGVMLRGRNRLTMEDKRYLVDELGIKTDLDLRSPREVVGMNGVSPLGFEVKYINHSSCDYSRIFEEHGKKVMAENFRVFCDRANYPILFHCIAGADRTGALAYVLNGVLGVKRGEIETDWESTFYPNIPEFNNGKPGELSWNSEQRFNIGFGKFGDENSTWNDRVVLYLKSCGITDEEIETFRSIMLEDQTK